MDCFQITLISFTLILSHCFTLILSHLICYHLNSYHIIFSYTWAPFECTTNRYHIIRGHMSNCITMCVLEYCLINLCYIGVYYCFLTANFLFVMLLRVCLNSFDAWWAIVQGPALRTRSPGAAVCAGGDCLLHVPLHRVLGAMATEQHLVLAPSLLRAHGLPLRVIPIAGAAEAFHPQQTNRTRFAGTVSQTIEETRSSSRRRRSS